MKVIKNRVYCSPIPVLLSIRVRYMRSTVSALAASMHSLDVFKLTEKFEKLSLSDNSESSSASSSDGSRILHRGKSVVPSQPKDLTTVGEIGYNMSFVNKKMHVLNPSTRLREIIKSTHAPFLDLPRGLLGSLYDKYNIYMGLGYRFKPGQSDFLMHELKVPQNFERLKILKDSLGLSMYKNTLPVQSLCSYSRSCLGGVKTLVDANYYKTLVEVITHYNGIYGRFLILSCAGIGSTVWYSFASGIDGQIPTDLFAPIVSYDPFFNMDHISPIFQSVGLAETMEISEQIRSAYESEAPFVDIEVPASGLVLKGVCLGIIIAFFLSVGILDPSNGLQNA